MTKQSVKARFQALFDPYAFPYKNNYTRSIASKIFKCHTAALGFHRYECDNTECQHSHWQYHSCGNRHCCFCGTMRKDDWVESRIDDLLPCPYYHIVFTVPHEWNKVMMQAPGELYKILFDAAASTLLILGENHQYLGGTPAITCVLHTWGQTLDYHVHLHCIVSGGGIRGRQWVPPKRGNGKFLFPVAALKKTYKANFLKLAKQRKKSIPVNTRQLEGACEKTKYKLWKVYAKKPFGGPEQVVKYLGRYTHRTAITYHRITAVGQQDISFNYKDYRDGKQKGMTLTHHEFLSRFERHILPYRFVRIRHYGLLSNYGKAQRLRELRDTMDWEQHDTKIKVPITVRMIEKYGRDITRCSRCGKGQYVLVITKRFDKVTYRARDVPL